MARQESPLILKPAPPGRRLQVIFLLVLVLLLAIDGVILFQASLVPAQDAWLLLAVSLPGTSLPLAIWAFAQIQAYEVADGKLIVRRRLKSPVYSLEGLGEVFEDAEAMRGTRKLLGNDGLGSISGHFKSQKYGRFRAYLSDPKRCVVLRWREGQTLLVSPLQPELLVKALKPYVR